MGTLALIPDIDYPNIYPNLDERRFNKKPIALCSIRHALNSKEIDHVLVITDSEETEKIANEANVHVHYVDPKDILSSQTYELEIANRALGWLSDNKIKSPELIAYLRTDFPIRDVADIDLMIKKLKSEPTADSIQSLNKIPNKLNQTWSMSEGGKLKSLLQETPCTQSHIFEENNSIRVIRTSTVLDKKSLLGSHVLGHEVPNLFTIDTVERKRVAEVFSRSQMLKAEEKLTFCFDIDGIIASIVEVTSYDTAGPLTDNIKLINKLYHMGHKIKLFTARGSETGIDWSEKTAQQMKRWGVCYHELGFGKPATDFYIDDKLISVTSLKYLTRNL